jgi:Holliday junction resolvasome RuvABC ATP-dependent DNA helicase subunit
MLLVKTDYLKKGSRGRVVTKSAYEHLGIKFTDSPAGEKNQQKLL